MYVLEYTAVPALRATPPEAPRAYSGREFQWPGLSPLGAPVPQFVPSALRLPVLPDRFRRSKHAPGK